MTDREFAFELAQRLITMELTLKHPAWARVIARDINRLLGRNVLQSADMRKARKMGEDAGAAIWEDAAARIMKAINGGDRNLGADLPRMLDIFGDEGRRILVDGFQLQESEGFSFEVCQVYDEAASEVYLARVRGFIRQTIEDFERHAGTRDNAAFSAVGLVFNALTALFALPHNFEHGAFASPDGKASIAASREQFTALLHRIMIAGGVAERVERSA